jgi:hypothetical protein
MPSKPILKLYEPNNFNAIDKFHLSPYGYFPASRWTKNDVTLSLAEGRHHYAKVSLTRRLDGTMFIG